MVTLHKLSQLVNLYFKLCVANDQDWVIDNIKYFLSFFMGDVESNSLTPEEIKHWANVNKLSLDTFQAAPRIINQNGTRLIAFPDIKKSNIDYYFSNSPTLPDTSEKEEITGERSLAPYNTIPPLFTCTKIVISETSKLDTATAHNFFVVRGLQKVSASSFENKDFLNSAATFIQDNIGTINQIKRYFQYTPREMGEGDDGVAFNISDFAVLKIFGSAIAMREMERAMHRIHKDPELAKTEAMIYDAGTLGEFSYRSQFGAPRTIPIFYSIIEKMTPMESIYNHDVESYATIMDIAHQTEDMLRHGPEDYLHTMRQLFNANEKQKLQQEITNFAAKAEAIFSSSMQDRIKKIEDKYLSSNKTQLQLKKQKSQPIQIRPNWLSSLIQEIAFKKATGRHDLHMGNLGITGYGDFRYFDPIYKD